MSHPTDTSRPETESEPRDPTSSRLRAYADELRSVASQLDLPMLADAIDKGTRARLTEGRVGALVIGEVNHGKSSLVNALIGEALVPMGVTPTTSTVIRLRQGRPAGAFAVDGDVRRPLGSAELDGLARGDGGQDIEILFDNPNLPPALELVDTPGFNDLDRLRSARARGGLPRADVLILCLDATQALTRTELHMVESALDAVGGLEGGAQLAVALNRIDLVDPSEHEGVIEHVRKALGKALGQVPEIFTTNAKLAAADADDESLGTREVERLRAWLSAVSADRDHLLPRRARALLLRHCESLSFNAALQRRALELEAETLDAEIAAVRETLAAHALDVEDLRVRIETRTGEIIDESHARGDRSREALQAQSLKMIEASNLEDLTEVVPGAIEDAFLAQVRHEASIVREALEALTAEILRTHADLARRRLIDATMHLGFRGPAIYVEPPSLAIEAGLVALGVVGTAVMAFGNMVSGLVMTVASPLTTVVLREMSVRQARRRASEQLPAALEKTFGALAPAIEHAVHQHAEQLMEQISQSAELLAEQLLAGLEAAKRRHRDQRRPRELDALREKVAGLQGAIEVMEMPEAESVPELLH